MPPTRTIPPAKAVKIERTHEENQERAYIAASRRSDRSLEARVESARRASDIHKRRTGRSLRITEQDVINEEMYEEEDDDLPMQYRRLTAHLQTGSADFNRRLSAYLTNHVAMRSALDHAITNSYAQQYPDAPQFANSQHSMFPSPMIAHQQQMMQPPQSPSLYRQSPYPSPHPQQPGFQPSQHQRSTSIATLQEVSGTSQASPAIDSRTGRRMSMPTVLAITGSPIETRTQGPVPSSTPQQNPSFPQGGFSQQSQRLSNQFLPSYDMGAFSNNYLPLSTVLPPESQMFLGSTLDPNDPLTSVMMAGSNTFPQQYYNFNTPLLETISIGKQHVHPSYDGLNSTLAPSALDLSQGTQDFNQSFFDQALKTGSPAGTPGLNGESWGSFIDTEQWEMPSASQ